jgi:hypothetical protein
MKNKISAILKQKQGLSLMFVLAFMLLLLALSISALTAAGLSHRAVLAQQSRNQLTLYADSMERVIMGLLTENNGDFDEIKKEILLTLYEVYRPGGGGTISNPFIAMETEIEGAEFVINIWIEESFVSVMEMGYTHMYIYDYGIFYSRVPNTWAHINAAIRVEQTVTRDDPNNPGNDTGLMTNTIYRNIGAVVREVAGYVDPDFDYSLWFYSAAPRGFMEVDDPGSWEFDLKWGSAWDN